MKQVLLAVLLLAPIAAHAQGIVQQLDAGLAAVTTTVSNMRQQIIQDQNEITRVTQQRDAQQKRAGDLQKQLDDAKLPPAPEATKK